MSGVAFAVGDAHANSTERLSCQVKMQACGNQGRRLSRRSLLQGAATAGAAVSPSPPSERPRARPLPPHQPACLVESATHAGRSWCTYATPSLATSSVLRTSKTRLRDKDLAAGSPGHRLTLPPLIRVSSEPVFEHVSRTFSITFEHVPSTFRARFRASEVIECHRIARRRRSPRTRWPIVPTCTRLSARTSRHGHADRNYIPLQSRRRPNFYEFGDDVLYAIHIDNTGNGEADSPSSSVPHRGGRREHLPVQHGPDHVDQQPGLQPPPVLRRHQGDQRVAKLARHQPGLPAVQHRAAVHAELPGAGR